VAALVDFNRSYMKDMGYSSINIHKSSTSTVSLRFQPSI
jgi:hypothetical protein